MYIINESAGCKAGTFCFSLFADEIDTGLKLLQKTLNGIWAGTQIVGEDTNNGANQIDAVRLMPLLVSSPTTTPKGIVFAANQWESLQEIIQNNYYRLSLFLNSSQESRLNQTFF
ncbi:hypothetical protein [Adhaeribacter pallidiroseus]|uniref:hypothetical protein n=1 Tax=Adhaeribacter pallidiroseus TaxID=2072847 RepID=UPI000E1B8033|nr:hypothetical protein [Adhaeribacter pallidiroseus]